MPTVEQICLHLTHLHTNAPTPGSQTTPTPAVIAFLQCYQCKAKACATFIQETARCCQDFRFDSFKKKPSSFAGVSLKISTHPLCSQIKEQLLQLSLRCTGRKRLHQACSSAESLQPCYMHIYHP